MATTLPLSLRTVSRLSPAATAFGKALTPELGELARRYGASASPSQRVTILAEAAKRLQKSRAARAAAKGLRPSDARSMVQSSMFAMNPIDGVQWSAELMEETAAKQVAKQVVVQGAKTGIMDELIALLIAGGAAFAALPPPMQIGIIVVVVIVVVCASNGFMHWW